MHVEMEVAAFREEEVLPVSPSSVELSSPVLSKNFSKAVEEATAVTVTTVETRSLASTSHTLPSVICTTGNSLISNIELIESNAAVKENGAANTRKKSRPQPFIPVLEAEGGNDKNVDGNRKDTVPIVQALEEAGARSSILQFREEFASAPSEFGQTEAEVSRRNNEARVHNDALRSSLLQTTSGDKPSPLVTGIVVRNNPGTLSHATQAKFDAMLTELYEVGVNVMNHPIVQQKMGAKDSLYKIRHLKSGMEDTGVYYDVESFRQGFRKSIAFQPRVIKQNRGSQGEGIWIIKLKNEDDYCKTFGERYASLDTPLILAEAYDNHIEEHTVGEFIEFCINGRTNLSGSWSSTGKGRYLDGGVESGAMIIDQRFLPRIVEGEVRCLMVGSNLVDIVHKVPQEGAYSATLASGAKYTQYAPNHPKFANLVANFEDDIPHIMTALDLEGHSLPLLWTADYIFGTKEENGSDTFYIGEFNCSCVGITTQLDVSKTVASQAIEDCQVNKYDEEALEEADDGSTVVTSFKKYKYSR